MEQPEVYRLQYTWRIAGRIERVFYYVGHAGTFPQWWGAVFLDCHSDAADPYLGASATVQARSILPYVLDWTLIVTELEVPHLIVLDSHVTLSGRFELTGSIAYRLVQEGPVVLVITDQHMRPSRPIPKLLRGVAARMFRFNHAWAMARGERGLQKIVSENP
jgi:uncharacterized protein YndB with AHSA1/START domain